MGSDALQQFRESRQALLKEKADIEKRLAALTEELAKDAPDAASHLLGPSLELGRSRKHFKNKMTLREAVRQLTAQRPLTEEEILTELKNLGYRFATADRKASLKAILRGTRQFRKKKGRYSSS